MTQHERYLITGVVLAAELKELQGGGFRRRRGEAGILRHSPFLARLAERSCPADSQPLSCHGFPRP